MNIPLLRRVQEKIRNEPKQFNMGGWGYYTRECGTICCIAGWAITFERFNGTLEKEEVLLGIFDEATALLGLSGTQSRHLFYPNLWDEPYRTQYSKLLMTYGYKSAEIANFTCEYIDYFIAKYATPEGNTKIDVSAKRLRNSLTSFVKRFLFKKFSHRGGTGIRMRLKISGP